MKLSVALALLLPFGPVLCHAGDGALRPVRREFKQETSYPYVFRSGSYLAAGGPVPLRFAVAGPDCGQRTAPPAPSPPPSTAAAPAEPANPAPIPSASDGAAVPAPTPDKAAKNAGLSQPAYAPSANAPSVIPPGQPDFSRPPDEVIEYFKNPYNPPDGKYRVFDPIFMPAKPDELPKSEATYRQE